MATEEQDQKDYINSLNLDLKTTKEVESLLDEYENGMITREEYTTLSWMAHSVTHSKGFNKGWSGGEKHMIEFYQET